MHSSASSGIPSSLPEEPEFRISEIHEARPKNMEPNESYETTSRPVTGGLPPVNISSGK